jgi:hypothetical protein
MNNVEVFEQVKSKESTDSFEKKKTMQTNFPRID